MSVLTLPRANNRLPLLGFGALLLGILLVAPRWLAPLDTAETIRSAVAAEANLVPQRQIDALAVGPDAPLAAFGKEAMSGNEAISFSGLPEQHMLAFRVGPAQMPAAEKCLTQAIYYEAGFEPIEGRRAVAQVVLNRVRHPGYPHSVCGVVYQGYDRPVCQFSFICDGSLLRRPEPGAWAAAEKIARAALSGYVEPLVGSATHYHANYVLPKWAYQLAKVQQIGAHLFYRFGSSTGNAAAFTSSYAGSEYIPQVNLARLPEPSSFAGSEAVVGPLAVPPAVTDRHAPADIGGRIDPASGFRLSLSTGSAYDKSLSSQTVKPADPSVAVSGDAADTHFRGAATAPRIP